VVALKRATTVEAHHDTVASFEAHLREAATSEILDTLLSRAPLAVAPTDLVDKGRAIPDGLGLA
jgi:hypothetical protein